MLASLFTVVSCMGQEITLVPYKTLKPSESAIQSISFNNQSDMLAYADNKNTGLISFSNRNQKDKVVIFPGGDVVKHDFIGDDNYFLVVQSSGKITFYDTRTLKPDVTETIAGKIVAATIDPNQHYLVCLHSKNIIEVWNLTSRMMFARIPSRTELKKIRAVEFDRFGQQLAIINAEGEAVSWSPVNQKFLRELKLQSTEYKNSRSVIHAVGANSGGDQFIVGFQEVFIPKGGMDDRGQPERRNSLIAFDWTTGQETKMLSVKNRVDGMALGPGPNHVIYFSFDSKRIVALNLANAIRESSVTVDEKPTSIAISDNGEWLAVGTAAGKIYIYEVIRNNPPEIRITKPGMNRNYGEQIIRNSSVQIEGTVESSDRITRVLVNGEEVQLQNSAFTTNIELIPGKNKINISAINSRMAVIEKDIYITSEPTSHGAHQLKTSRRKALIIGNAAYTSAAPLRNTTNDALSMDSVLQTLGFETTRVLDGTYESMKNAIYSFGDQIASTDIALFYYAGHGVEVDGTNYLIPVDATIQSPLDVKMKGIPLTGVLRTMEFANDESLNMIILDACRNNPFPKGLRSAGDGLAEIKPPSGTLIAYATDPGSVASDGTGKNGLYTGELIKQLSVSQRIEDIFMNTRNSVEHISGGSQRPWEEARLKGVFYLK